MSIRKILLPAMTGIAIMGFHACKVPEAATKQENKSVPSSYQHSTDTTNMATLQWRQYFKDPLLIAIVDTALKNNQELNIALQEIGIGKNEIKARKGEYLPFVNLGATAGVDRAARYSWDGISEEDLKANPDKGPKYIGEFTVAAYASWELDVWRKLRNATKAASMRYLASIEGRNFIVTNIIGEIAGSYYELLALDKLLAIIRQNIDVQKDALRIVKLEKDAARVSQLAVNRFDAQLLNTENLQYEIRQRIVETENRINFLAGRFPQPIQRDTAALNDIPMDMIRSGIPSQLLLNRPDIRQAELELAATRLDVQVARANFYPSFRITSAVGLSAFNPTFVFRPESLLYNLIGDAIGPLINRNAIKATYSTANLRQISSAFNYEQSILNAHIEVVNQLAQLENYSKSYDTKAREVEILNQSIDISNKLFISTRADYIEVLLTQREALDSRIELVETKLKQLHAKVNIYRALGGGWN